MAKNDLEDFKAQVRAALAAQPSASELEATLAARIRTFLKADGEESASTPQGGEDEQDRADAQPARAAE